MEYYLEVLRKYAVFEGRARRSEYWYFALFNAIISTVLTVGIGEWGSLYSLGVFIPSIAVGVRRMHDVGKSGWFLLIPIYNIILACTEGDRGSNSYGFDPKNPALDNGYDDQLV